MVAACTLLRFGRVGRDTWGHSKETVKSHLPGLDQRLQGSLGAASLLQLFCLYRCQRNMSGNYAVHQDTFVIARALH